MKLQWLQNNNETSLKIDLFIFNFHHFNNFSTYVNFPFHFWNFLAQLCYFCLCSRFDVDCEIVFDAVCSGLPEASSLEDSQYRKSFPLFIDNFYANFLVENFMNLKESFNLLLAQEFYEESFGWFLLVDDLFSKQVDKFKENR